MPQGLQCWDASGTLLVDITDRLTRILGVTTVSAGGSGTVTDDGFLTGSPFCIAIRSAVGLSTFNSSMVPPDISFASNVMSYAANSPSGDHYLIYGVY